MNFNKSVKMLPIFIGLSSTNVIAQTDLLFSESQILKDFYLNKAKSSIEALHELNITSENFQRYKFEEFYNQWKINTRFYSNPNLIIKDENFQNIINMKEFAVPLILSKIQNEHSPLIWALNIILNKKISNNPNTSIDEASKLWVNWGKKNRAI